MKRIGKIFTLFLVLLLCFFGCKNNEDDSSSKKIIATFEEECEPEIQESPVFINFYDNGSWDAISLSDGKKTFFYEGIYEGNTKKDGFVKLIIQKTMGKDSAEYEEIYIIIKNGKFNLYSADFIRQ